MIYGNSNINGLSNANSSGGSMDSGNTTYALIDAQIYNIAHSICDKILKIIDEVNTDGRK